MHTFYLGLTGMRLAGFWLIALLALADNPAWAAQKNTPAPPPKAGSIVKWVDEKGITHYGDSMPPEYSAHGHSELDRQGHVVKHNKAEDSQANKAAADESKVSAEQQRHDSALLAAYTTEQEFDLARDRNMETDKAAIEGLNQNMGSAKDRLAATKKTTDGFSKNKKPIPAYVTQDLKEIQDEITKVEAQIAERQQSMDEIRQRFEKDKQRFIELKRGPNAPPPPATPAPVAVAAPVAPVATTAPMAAPKAPTAKLAPTLPPAAKPAPAPEKLVAVPADATPAQPIAPAATKPISPAEKTTTTTPAPAAPATKPAKKIKRVVMP